MEEEIYIECDHCGAKYTIISNDIRMSELGESDEYDIWPQYCPFCGKEIYI